MCDDIGLERILNVEGPMICVEGAMPTYTIESMSTLEDDVL